jgi:predicted metal-binding protein
MRMDVARDAGPDAETGVLATIYVCITCRRPGDSEDAPRAGASFARTVAAAAEGAGIAVRDIRCLGNCKRGLSAMIAREGAWTYVFGGLDPAKDDVALIAGAQLLARSTDGLMPWNFRPEPLKRGLVARVPPPGYREAE